MYRKREKCKGRNWQKRKSVTKITFEALGSRTKWHSGIATVSWEGKKQVAGEIYPQCIEDSIGNTKFAKPQVNYERNDWPSTINPW